MKSVLLINGPQDLGNAVAQLDILRKTKPKHFLIISSAYVLARVVLGSISRYYDENHIKIASNDGSSTSIELYDGTVYEARPLGKGDKIRRMKYDYLVVYEPYSIPSDILKGILL